MELGERPARDNQGLCKLRERCGFYPMGAVRAQVYFIAGKRQIIDLVHFRASQRLYEARERSYAGLFKQWCNTNAFRDTSHKIINSGRGLQK